MTNMNDKIPVSKPDGLFARIFYAFLNAIQDYFIRRRLDGKGL